MIKFVEFTDCPKGFLRRYRCDEYPDLFMAVHYRGKSSVFALVFGRPDVSLCSQSYEIFVDSQGFAEYLLFEYCGRLVRFRADNYEDFPIIS